VVVSADRVEVDNYTLIGDRIIGVDLEQPELTDVRIEDSDLSGVVLSSPTIRRASLLRTRLRDCVFGGAMVQDTEVNECPTEQLIARFATLQRVTFRGCLLAGADFYGVTFDKVAFEDCDLTGAHFDNAVVKDLTLRRCGLLGLTGALSLRGAHVDLDDLAALAPSLAREAGLLFDVD